MRTTWKRLGILGAAIVLFWGGTIAVDALRAFAPNSGLRYALLDKPLAAVHIVTGRWGTDFTYGDAGEVPDLWEQYFRKSTGTVNAESRAAKAEVLLVLLPPTDTQDSRDALVDYFEIEKLVQAMGDGSVRMTARMTAKAWLSWPFLHLSNRRHTVVRVNAALDGFEKDCHADLVTAWATQHVSRVRTLWAECRSSA